MVKQKKIIHIVFYVTKPNILNFRTSDKRTGAQKIDVNIPNTITIILKSLSLTRETATIEIL